MTLFRTVRFRLVMWYGTALALSVSALGAGVYFTVGTTLARQLEADLNQDFLTVQNALQDDLEELQELEDHGVVSHFRVARGGVIVYRTSGWRNAELEGALAAGKAQSSWKWESSTEDRSYLLRVGEVGDGGLTASLVVARDMGLLSRSLHALAVTLLVGLPLVLVLAALGGYFLAGRVLAPVGAMATKAREISADRLSHRLPADSDDEFGQLARVFNDVLARLEQSFEQLRRFTAEASHELRTPLTAMRTVGEVGLQHAADPSELRDVIGSMLEEADRLTGLVDSLLTLTRSEGGTTSLSFEEVDLLALTHECVDLLQALAEEKEQTISVEGEEITLRRGDRSLLRQALLNLLDNAIKYTPAGGRIALSVGPIGDSEVVVEVQDTGPGIPTTEQASVFDRFYRVETGQHRPVPGAGLGLSIVRWAVEAQGGRVELQSDGKRGSVFRLVFPKEVAGGPDGSATSKGAQDDPATGKENP